MEIINAVFYIKEDQRAAFMAAVEPLLASARAEAGCHGYHLYESTEEPNRFVMVEKWADQAAIDAHNQTAELQHLFKKMPEFAAKPTEITVTHQGE
ncbi:putative quinol monooxygenase [Enterococcus sp. RIT-PI-f]|uniref:putative quinol monooxygenase n=1 Tax=Enterococcus sp. RIT-PI-f TaxID=1690244 RepID=UPI0006B9F7DB|nr:putative quinol monooxygenase [Enterococcus sp. RIT-PI-f]KPG70196.1 antibiotic biosynthesis monooxygenase [Enterococcus sp. RIT-PI-f]